MNDSGQLRKLLSVGFEKAESKPCSTCGSARYINCTWCQGSKKSIQTAFQSDFKRATLKCTVCNENGLIPCPTCEGEEA
eukprot:m.292939 g.292939  ORF g.292939 m.292939 type:complete len:79 (+) comp55118_c0_seq32:1651-1887(+)